MHFIRRTVSACVVLLGKGKSGIGDNVGIKAKITGCAGGGFNRIAGTYTDDNQPLDLTSVKPAL